MSNTDPSTAESHVSKDTREGAGIECQVLVDRREPDQSTMDLLCSQTRLSGVKERARDKLGSTIHFQPAQDGQQTEPLVRQ